MLKWDLVTEQVSAVSWFHCPVHEDICGLVAWAWVCCRKSIRRGACAGTMKGCNRMPLMFGYPMAFLHFHQGAECVPWNHTPQHWQPAILTHCMIDGSTRGFVHNTSSQQHETTGALIDLNEHCWLLSSLTGGVFQSCIAQCCVYWEKQMSVKLLGFLPSRVSKHNELCVLSWIFWL